MTNSDYANDLALLANTLFQAESLLHNLSKHQLLLIQINQISLDVSTFTGTPLKLEYLFAYLGINVLSTDNDVNIRLVKAWKALDRLMII